MKRLYSLLFIALIGFCGNAQIVNIPDAHFKAKLIASGVDTNNDGNIQQSEALAKTGLTINASLITDLTGINAFVNLQYLDFSNNQVSDLSVLNGLVNLQTLDCSLNQITTLTTLNNLPLLTFLNCGINPLTNVSGIANLPLLNTLLCYNCTQLVSLSDVVTHPLTDLSCGYNPNLQLATISGANNLRTLSCPAMSLTSLDVIYGLSNLTSLTVDDNQLSQIDLSHFPNLEYFSCRNNNLISLDLSHTPNLVQLYYSQNNITNIDLSSVPNLHILECYNNNISSLNLSSVNNLSSLACANNQLTQLDISNLSLGYLNCNDNQLTALDISHSPYLQYLFCAGNLFTTIDANHLSEIYQIDCSNMPNLESVFMKSSSYHFYSWAPIVIDNCPNLRYICAPDNLVPVIEQTIANSGNTNCHVNSYCTFVPSGTFYTIQGNTRFDSNNNGCSAGDINLPNLKLAISDGATTANLIADGTGAYHYNVQSGFYTIAPLLENPSYFHISPSTTNISLPAITNPYLQNFCITANGVHNDLEVTLLPINSARPGFDATYKIIYKNKGTGTQSGAVNFTFNDGVLDLVSANPSNSSQGINNLSWTFSNLLPFESREIIVTLNVNTPSESPAVNGGDILPYTATVTGLTDETPTDNTATLNQTVVNSFDPNDKTCLEGSVITPSMVGDYVHYMIRFENTGTANAENIVVRDIIDTTKFDISSLVSLSGSAPFVTRITNTNMVEFIFQNINLPFDDAHNDGYVMFKIKTKPTLAISDTFSNTANIYFDYNAPIVTNTATTAVQTLGNSDFEFGNVFSLSPVPVSSVLTITTKAAVTLSSVNIYNTLGQLVLVQTNPNKSIDVSELKSGTYLIKIVSDKGTSSSKFIKE